MEFHEKLQDLRKGKGLTQEELAEALYVSRTAISKWEQGRGYPSLDSLKEISKFFSVSIDGLLSGEALISIAEREHQSKMQKVYDLILGLVDLCAFALIVLPLYPKTIDGFVYSVNLINYDVISDLNLIIHWSMFLLMAALGVGKLFLLRYKPEKKIRIISDISIGLNIVVLLFLALAREAYATVILIMMLVVKIVILLKACYGGELCKS